MSARSSVSRKANDEYAIESHQESDTDNDTTRYGAECVGVSWSVTRSQAVTERGTDDTCRTKMAGKLLEADWSD